MVRRYLQPISAADTSVDSLVVVVTGHDSAGGADTAHARDHHRGRSEGDDRRAEQRRQHSRPASASASPRARRAPTASDASTFASQGEANWPTKLDTTISQVYSNSPRDVTFTTTARIPINAPIRGKITVTATAVDVNRQPGSSAPVARVRARGEHRSAARHADVLPKTEFADSVSVSATGDAITLLGVIVRDSAQQRHPDDSLPLSGPLNANARASVALNLSRTLQGQTPGITGFAVDQAGRVGYAVAATHASSLKGTSPTR